MLVNNHNPDVLSCIANLSNDEVFTPKRIVNLILDDLPKEIWSNKNIKFLDPVSKSGIFLREITIRLFNGLSNDIKDDNVRLNHILKNQIFGISISELTYLLSKRTIYCSKNLNDKNSIIKNFNENSGNIYFEKSSHEWDKNDRCIFCSATKKIYDRLGFYENYAYPFIHKNNFEKKICKMKFDVIIGNPPYQLKDGGHEASAKPLYHLFVNTAKKLQPRYMSMIIPSRWFSGGKGLENFREEMLNDKRITKIHDFLNANECFPGVEIKGGVCYFLWDRDNPGNCEIITHENNRIISKMNRPLLEKGTSTFIRYNQAIPIYKKIKKLNENSFISKVNPAKTFGLRTYFKGEEKKFKNSIKLYQNNGIGYIKNSQIKVNDHLINSYKVIVPEAVGTGNSKTDKLKPIYCEPGSICTETYIMIGPFKSKKTCENVISYINTKFFHFLLTLKKNTQHTSRNFYEFIPLQNFDEAWNDKKLYSKYKLDKSDISNIEKMVWPSKDE